MGTHLKSIKSNLQALDPNTSRNLLKPPKKAMNINAPGMKADKAQVEKFQKSYKDLQNIQQQVQEHQKAASKLEAQLQENSMVLSEVELVDADSTIFKMVGPALIEQDTDEVKMNVKSRISHIKDDIKRHEDQGKIVAEMQALEQKLLENMKQSGLIKANQ